MRGLCTQGLSKLALAIDWLERRLLAKDLAATQLFNRKGEDTNES